MKRFLSSLFLFALALSFAHAQPVSGTPPWTVDQYTYTNAAGHTVPFAMAYSKLGVGTLVLDPTVSSQDAAATWAHLQLAGTLPGAIPTTQTTQSGIVNMAIDTQIYRQSSDFSIQTSTTLTTIPGLQGVVQTAGHYIFRAVLLTTTGTSGGIKIDFGGTSSTSNVIAVTTFYEASSTVSNQQTSFLSGPSGATAVVYKVVIEGEFDVGNGGTFVIQDAQNASNGTATVVKSGSTLTLKQIP